MIKLNPQSRAKVSTCRLTSLGRDKTPEKSSSSGSDKQGPKKKVQFEGPTAKAGNIKSTITDTIPPMLDVLPSDSLKPSSQPKLHDLLPVPSTKEDEIFVPTALLSHLHHTEESFMNPVTEVPNILAYSSRVELNESPYVEKRKVLEGIARIEVEMEADEPQIFSFHYLYKEYLDDGNLMDVSIQIQILLFSLREPNEKTSWKSAD